MAPDFEDGFRDLSPTSLLLDVFEQTTESGGALRLTDLDGVILFSPLGDSVVRATFDEQKLPSQDLQAFGIGALPFGGGPFIPTIGLLRGAAAPVGLCGPGLVVFYQSRGFGSSLDGCDARSTR